MISVDDRRVRPCRVAADGTGKDVRSNSPHSLRRPHLAGKARLRTSPRSPFACTPDVIATGTRSRRAADAQGRLPPVLADRSGHPHRGGHKSARSSRSSRNQPTCGDTASFGSAPPRSGGATARFDSPRVTAREGHDRHRFIDTRGTTLLPAHRRPAPLACPSRPHAGRALLRDAGCRAQRHRDPCRRQRRQYPLSRPMQTALAHVAHADRFHGARCSVELFLHDVFDRVADPRPHRHLDGVGAERRTSRPRRLASWCRAPRRHPPRTRRRQAGARADLWLELHRITGRLLCFLRSYDAIQNSRCSVRSVSHGQKSGLLFALRASVARKGDCSVRSVSRWPKSRWLCVLRVSVARKADGSVRSVPPWPEK